MYVHYFPIISLVKGRGPLFEYLPRMLCAKYGWNYPIGSGEENENGESLQQQRRRRTTAKCESEKLSWAKMLY